MTHKSPLRFAKVEDLSQVVNIHMASFPGFFLTSLGPRFLRVFYSGLIELEIGRLMVWDDEDGLKGFVGGAIDQDAFYSQLLRQKFLPLAVAAALVALRRPWALVRILRARKRVGTRAESSSAWLMTLGVAPTAESRGVGRGLVTAFLNTASLAGSRFVSLTTDADKNDRVNLFYRSLGFSLRDTYVTHEGRSMNMYRIDVSPSEARG